MTEPEWLDYTAIGSPYEQQLDVRTRPDAPAHEKMRHRLRSLTGEAERPWSPGPPPTVGPGRHVGPIPGASGGPPVALGDNFGPGGKGR